MIFRTISLASVILFFVGAFLYSGMSMPTSSLFASKVYAGDCGQETDGMTEAQKQALEKACEAAKQAAEKARESAKKQTTTTQTTTTTPPQTTSSPQETYTTTSPVKQQKVVTPVVVPPTFQTLTRYIKVIDSGYDGDTDGDGLVDAIDPDPSIPQEKYYTDSDGDTIPDALDKYPGVDDFFVEADDAEKNKNGVLDWMEGN